MGQKLAVQPGLVVLTRYDSSFGASLLHQLAAQGARPELIVVAQTSLNERFRMAKFLASKIGWVDALRYNRRFIGRIVKRWLSRGTLNSIPDFSVFGAPILSCKNINDLIVVQALSSSSFSRVILAQSGIVRKGILALPDKWIVNAHPASLPEYRGVDVVKWALRDGSPICVTLHLVRAGVDTGEILHVEDVPVLATDSIEDVEARTISVSQKLLLRAACSGPNGFQSPVPQQAAGKQHYLMPFAQYAELKNSWKQIRANYVKTTLQQRR